jgi:hypothetical protein
MNGDINIGRKLLSILLRTLAPLLMLLAGCSSRTAGTINESGISPQILLTVRRGASQKQLETMLGVPARHEFTVSSDHMAIRCVSYQFPSFYLKYYFVLTNDALEEIILPPRYEHELSPWEQGKRAVWKSANPQERVEVVLHATDLDQEGITDSIERRYRPEKFDNALPAAAIAGVVAAPVALVRGQTENREIKVLAETFDPYRVHLGMPLAAVEQMFGAPRLIEKLESGSETRYYGSPKLGTQNPLLWVSVVFNDEKAICVFSDDFFDYRKLAGINEKPDK